MPRREARFEVEATPAELWRFLRDFEALCTCIPGVERIQVVDSKTVELTVREKVGVVPMILALRAQIDSEDPPHRLHATAKAEHLTMSIDVSLQGSGSHTEMVSVFDVQGEGQLKPIVDRLFEKRATERSAQFAECLQKRFAAAEVRQPAPATQPQEQDARARPGWIVRLLQWLKRKVA